MKICMTASSGGHLEELAQLKELLIGCDSFLITEQTNFEEITLCDKVYRLRQINRKEKGFPLYFIKLFLQSFRIFWKEKPDVLISTGALVTVPISLVCKLFHKKIIYIESFARVDTQSLTGKIMYPIANLFLVQSEELLKYYPKAEYVGCIFK